MTDREIGLKVNKLRQEQGMTTTELAKRVGVSQAQISRLENGKQGFRSRTLARIGEALGVRPVYFYLAPSPQDGIGRGELIGAPGKLGEAMKSPEFRVLVDKAAQIYVEKRAAFGSIAQAIQSVPQ